MEDSDPLVVGDPDVTGGENLSSAVLPEQRVLPQVVGHTRQEGIATLGLDHGRVADPGVVV